MPSSHIGASPFPYVVNPNTASTPSPPSPSLSPSSSVCLPGLSDDEGVCALLAPEVELSSTARMLSATIGALITSCVVTPFDVVKTRLQAQLHPLQHSDHTHSHSTSSSSSSSSTAPPSPSSSSASSRARHLSNKEMLQRCSHVRLETGFVDSWCHRCTYTAPRYVADGGFIPYSNSYVPTPAYAGTHAPHIINGTTAASSQHFTSTWDAVVKLIKNEGIGSMWRGLSPQLLLSIPSTIVYFGAYDRLKLTLQSITDKPNPTRLSERNARSLAAFSPLIAGTSARAVTTILVSPIELIRTRTQSLPHSVSMIQIARAEIQKGGLRSLWRGANPTLWRDIPFSACYWTCYEWMKAKLLQRAGKHVRMAVQRGEDVNTAYQRHLMWNSFVAGASSGMLSAVVTHPFDLVKTRRQIEMYNLVPLEGAEAEAASSSSSSSANTQQQHHTTTTHTRSTPPTTTMSVFRTIIREEGWIGLTTGMLARMTKIAPACAIMISTYELAKAKFGQRNAQALDRERKQKPLTTLGGSDNSTQQKATPQSAAQSDEQNPRNQHLEILPHDSPSGVTMRAEQ